MFGEKRQKLEKADKKEKDSTLATKKKPRKINKKKNLMARLLITLAGLIGIFIIVPQIIWGVTGLALLKEAMSGEHKIIDRIQEMVLGRKK